jgi:RNA polymerase subunit RPABC4/transcription elongation factor Spt4
MNRCKHCEIVIDDGYEYCIECARYYEGEE